MKRIARKHHFNVLLHEKPYSGVNGSGKHNNWSLCTDTGINLFAPRKESERQYAIPHISGKRLNDGL